MKNYLDGYLLTVPQDRLPAYRKLARKASVIYREHGALNYVESVGEDMAPPFGRPFPKLLKAAEDEVVIFAWITYKSRAHRDRVNRAVMQDPRMEALCGRDQEMPFNPKRMSWGGFSVIVQAGGEGPPKSHG